MQRIIFFDGDCNLCDAFVSTLFKIDKNHEFLYASLQSQTAKQLLKTPDLGPDSIVYFEEGRSYHASDAIVKILRQLKGPFKVLSAALRFIPRPILDFIYKKIAANRYRLFGKKELCRVPTISEKAYFLE